MGGMVVVAGLRDAVGCGRCLWWGTGHVERWLLVWQAVVGVPLRVPVREFPDVVGEDDRWGAWWRPDGAARFLATWRRVVLCGRCEGCVLIPLVGWECGGHRKHGVSLVEEHLKWGVLGASGGVSVLGVVYVVGRVCAELGVETEGYVND